MSFSDGFKQPSHSAKTALPVPPQTLLTLNAFDVLRVADSTSVPNSPSFPLLSAPPLGESIAATPRKRRRRRNKGGPNLAPPSVAPLFPISGNDAAPLSLPQVTGVAPSRDRLVLINGSNSNNEIVSNFPLNYEPPFPPAQSLPRQELTPSTGMESERAGPSVPSPNLGLPFDARAGPRQPSRAYFGDSSLDDPPATIINTTTVPSTLFNELPYAPSYSQLNTARPGFHQGRISNGSSAVDTPSPLIRSESAPRPRDSNASTISSILPRDSVILGERSLATIREDDCTPVARMDNASPDAHSRTSAGPAPELVLTCGLALLLGSELFWPATPADWHFFDLRDQLCAFNGTNQAQAHLLSIIGEDVFQSVPLTDAVQTSTMDIRLLWDGPCDEPNVSTRILAISDWKVSAAHVNRGHESISGSAYYSLKRPYLDILHWTLRATQALLDGLASLTDHDPQIYSLDPRLGLYATLGHASSVSDVLRAAAITLSRLALVDDWMEFLLAEIYIPDRSRAASPFSNRHGYFAVSTLGVTSFNNRLRLGLDTSVMPYLNSPDRVNADTRGRLLSRGISFPLPGDYRRPQEEFPEYASPSPPALLRTQRRWEAWRDRPPHEDALPYPPRSPSVTDRGSMIQDSFAGRPRQSRYTEGHLSNYDLAPTRERPPFGGIMTGGQTPAIVRARANAFPTMNASVRNPLPEPSNASRRIRAPSGNAPGARSLAYLSPVPRSAAALGNLPSLGLRQLFNTNQFAAPQPLARPHSEPCDPRFTPPFAPHRLPNAGYPFVPFNPAPPVPPVPPAPAPVPPAPAPVPPAPAPVPPAPAPVPPAPAPVPPAPAPVPPAPAPVPPAPAPVPPAPAPVPPAPAPVPPAPAPVPPAPAPVPPAPAPVPPAPAPVPPAPAPFGGGGGGPPNHPGGGGGRFPGPPGPGGGGHPGGGYRGGGPPGGGPPGGGPPGGPPGGGPPGGGPLVLSVRGLGRVSVGYKQVYKRKAT